MDILKKETSVYSAGKVNAAQMVSPEVIADGAAIRESQNKPSKVRKICVLRCGTVMLRNFNENLGEPGRQLKLVREPNNKYDRWATKVCSLEGTMLGYLPSGKNQSVARLMDAGKNITAFVDEELCIPESSPHMPSHEDARLPLSLYMDIFVPEENEQ